MPPIAARAYDTAEGVVAVQEVEGLMALTDGDLARLKDRDRWPCSPRRPWCCCCCGGANERAELALD